MPSIRDLGCDGNKTVEEASEAMEAAHVLFMSVRVVSFNAMSGDGNDEESTMSWRVDVFAEMLIEVRDGV